MLWRSPAVSVVGAILISIMVSPTARAVDSVATRYVPDGVVNGAGAFVDFHARPGPDLVGHSFIVYGRLDNRGRIIEAKKAGFFTKERLYLVGLFIPLPGFIGGEREDATVKSAVVYRRYLTPRQLSDLEAAVRRLRASASRHSRFKIVEGKNRRLA